MNKKGNGVRATSGINVGDLVTVLRDDFFGNEGQVVNIKLGQAGVMLSSGVRVFKLTELCPTSEYTKIIKEKTPVRESEDDDSVIPAAALLAALDLGVDAVLNTTPVEEPYVGEGGQFGGAGASASWDDTPAPSADVDDTSGQDSSGQDSDYSTDSSSSSDSSSDSGSDYSSSSSDSGGGSDFGSSDS